ncbi:PD-(D/E)XK nuclease family protein [Sorangium sp. So ce131]|uniref:PDDEXK-like family protein n=1 Tax=Sorangium sp. So ce131 TaxID=3133282 RepID=UPI003F5D9589
MTSFAPGIEAYESQIDALTAEWRAIRAGEQAHRAAGVVTYESQIVALAAEWRTVIAGGQANRTSEVASEESQIAALAAEWRAILALEQANRTAKVAAWEARVAELRAEHDALLRDGAWVGGPDDTLSILGINRKELYHSALLAWLLDPQSRHGLGSRFLEAVLRRCTSDLPTSDLHRARPALEVAQGNARADIVVTGPGLCLVIENKVDAGEQPRQCDRLFESFGREPGALFVFLSPSGRAPETATDSAQGAFHPMSYADIASMLRDALAHAPWKGATVHGREVASNYLATLEKEFQ